MQEKNLDEEWEKFKAWIEEMERKLGVTYEDKVAAFIKVTLEEKGYKIERIEVRESIPICSDNKTREIDIFSGEPLVVGELAYRLGNLEEAKKEVEKVIEDEKFIEEALKRKVEFKFLAVRDAPQNIIEELKKMTKENNIIFTHGKEIVLEV